MAEAFLVYGDWGCYEVGVGFVEEWFEDEAIARARFNEIVKEYKASAASEAAMIEESESLIWTSDEYFHVVLLKLNNVTHAERKLDRAGIASMAKIVEDSNFDLSQYVLRFEGRGWGENGDYPLDESDVVRQVAEYFE